MRVVTKRGMRCLKRWSCGGWARSQSDHLTALRAYMACDAAGPGRFAFCRENFLGIKTIQIIAGLKRQLLELLSEAGFVRQGLRSRAVEALGRRLGGGSDGVRLALTQGTEGADARGGAGGGCYRCGGAHLARDCAAVMEEAAPERLSGDDVLERHEEQARKTPLLKALLVAALYPQVAEVELPEKKAGKGPVKPPSPQSLKFRIRKPESGVPAEVALHPSSVNAKTSVFDSRFLVFHEKVKTTRVYLRDVSTVSPYSLMLFGGTLTAEETATGATPRGGRKRRDAPVDSSVLCVDGWIRFKCPRNEQHLMLEARKELHRVLKLRIQSPAIAFTEVAEGLIVAVIQLLSEG
ncbi:hypothetical protein CYMTET_46015 [Cymbomonas tetramitiformis]|uniref:Uncharacterized protein n=1 Tax=Cymbomonas tetramitiformis TaxID=36881 RepID=A0AAE0BZ21_9CHLO|nr:hypothetical protein CYMTET_46016 [Cymbomonas tetramitiformis]KAK3244367.1 hypothetical protein CYMTET_46015 [Cymbomonas tetramitiformis]